MTIHLLDYLAYTLHCNVCELRDKKSHRVIYEIEKIDAEQCSLQEWIETACYLCHKELNFETRQDAREYILNNLGKSA